jgi:hypothetical protein
MDNQKMIIEANSGSTEKKMRKILVKEQNLVSFDAERTRNTKTAQVNLHNGARGEIRTPTPGGAGS